MLSGSAESLSWEDPTSLHPGNRLNMDSMLAAWNTSGFYELISGILPPRATNGLPDFHFDIEANPDAPLAKVPGPTSDRVRTHVHAHPDGQADATIIFVGEWGHPTAAYDGDMTSTILSTAWEAGYRNPELRGFNVQGMGTRSYLANLGTVSRFGLSAHREDARALMRGELSRIDPSSDVYFVGHSLGAYLALPMMREILEREEGTSSSRIKGYVALNGITGNRWEFLHPKPLRATAPHLLQTTKEISPWFGGRALELAPADTARIMFGEREMPPSERTREQHARTLPASARAFFELALPVELHDWDDLITDFRRRIAEISLWLVDTFYDSLLPNNNSEVLADRLGARGIESRRMQVPGRHSFPVTHMPRHQAVELGNAFRAVFGKRRGK